MASSTDVLGKVGADNFIVRDCPMLIPKENLQFFKTLRKSCDSDPFPGYPNLYRPKK